MIPKARSIGLPILGRTLTACILMMLVSHGYADDRCATGSIPQSTTVAAAGGLSEFEVQGAIGCQWTASSDAAWIIPVRSSGAAGDLVSVLVSPLPKGTMSRTGNLLIGDVMIPITQSVASQGSSQSLRLFGDVTINSRDALRRYSTVAAGAQFTLAVTGDSNTPNPDVGRVIGFGRSQYNQCILPGQNEGFAQVSAGESHSMALSNGNGVGTIGLVTCWGDASGGKCAVPTDLGPCRAISAGSTFSMALTSSGLVRCWGFNTFGQCTVPGTNGVPSFPPGIVVAIAAGEAHGMALISQSADAPVNAVVHVWGSDQFGQITRQPAGLTDVVQIAAGANHCVALKSDGSVVCWGRVNEGQCAVPPGITARQIDARANYTLAVTGASSLRTWGNDPPDFTVQQQQRLESEGVRIARAGTDHIAVLTETTGRLVFGGRNEYFQCNGELLINRVEGITSGRFSFASWNDIGRFQVSCTAEGASTYGVCSIPETLERVHMIALGQEHAVAIERNTRRVAVWGDNSESQCALPSGLQPAVLVAAGEAHSASIANDVGATLRCWGRTVYGQCNVPELVGTPVKLACGRNHTLAIVHDLSGRASVRGWVPGVVPGSKPTRS